MELTIGCFTLSRARWRTNAGAQIGSPISGGIWNGTQPRCKSRNKKHNTNVEIRLNVTGDAADMCCSRVRRIEQVAVATRHIVNRAPHALYPTYRNWELKCTALNISGVRRAR